MNDFREKGAYYDVPSDNISFEVKEGMYDGTYDPNMYMKKQRKMASESSSKLSSEKFNDSRYC